MKFIFQIKIKEGRTEEEYIHAWKKGSAAIQTSLGAKGTILYREIDEPGTLRAIATWESKEMRDAGMQKLQEADIEIQTVINKHNAYGEIDLIGNFEELARIDPK